MAYTSLGFSLPDLAVSGESAPTAAWGGTLTVNVTLQNLGASTITEPTSLVPASEVQIGPDGAVVPSYYTSSQADAPASSIAVFLVPRGKGLASGISLGTIDAPAIAQNSLQQLSATLTLPAQPAGFPASGGYSIRLIANPDRAFLESNYRNNVSAPLNVRIQAVTASALRATAFDVPDTLVPGSTIQPTIQITNLGATAVTSDVQVAVVASTSPDFNLGSTIVGAYTISGGVNGVNSTPLPNAARHGRGARWLQANNVITPQSNVVTLSGLTMTLPTSPSTYYIGVVVDPNNLLNLPNQPSNRLELIKTVTTNAGQATTVVTGSAASFDFENPPDGVPIGIVS
ncbi:hypothetical protein [Paludisphaera rhizosphaerae]|uniref:hypothetical protein n=1 Tax=Paludisphaera rhizosphaerae TaxID=2711216 RepID=UPI0013ED5D6F|nr:hypothetical protein [Paludisphaera rhizosphaerae]